MRPETSTLGQILLARGLVTEDVLAEAQFEQRAMHKPLGRILVDRNVITEAQLLAGLAEQMSLDFVDLGDQPVDAAAVALVPEVLARRHGIIPIGFDTDGRLRLAMSDPANVLAIDDVRTITDLAVVPVVATYDDVLVAIGENSPRTSAGACGLRSKLSCWASPPERKT